MANAIENKISDGINSALESVVSGKEEYYSKNPLPSIGDVKGLISSYSYKNAAISGGAGLIPGLWGMAAAVPEIITIVRNQMAMVKIRPLLSPRAKMLLQIHDKLIFEVQDGCAEEFGAAAQKIMQEIYKLNVPLKTSLNVAKDWGGAKIKGEKMKIYDELKSCLKAQNDLLDEKQEIKKWVVLERARSFDGELLSLLLGNETIKSEFFKEISGATVFMQDKFCDFLELKSFMPDSFTSFKNQIGLSSKDKFIGKSREVVLNFPYKDCVLEGGASHDDDKGNEIFFNEILARDEITQLCDPKVLTAFERIGRQSQSVSQSVSPTQLKGSLVNKFNRNAEINLARNLPQDTITDSLLIKGNNLLALHSLKKEFAGRVKLIYIDPPYNTGNDSFNYNDSFNHSTWLVFMKNRLEIARELLREDGSIYVNLDYNQVHYCKVLMDEIFGLENFQREVIWRIGWLSGYKTGVSNYVRNHDSILFYSKNKNKMFFNKIYIDNSNFKELVSKNKLTDILCDYDMDKKQISNIYNKINFDTRIKRYPIEDVWNANEYDDLNSIAIVSYSGESVSKMLGTDEVKGQKSEKLIQRIIQSSTNENDIILDFFAGSGTTAAVAMKMNRQFIAIEQMDYIETITKDRLKKVIEGEQGGASRALGWQGGGEFVYFELKKHNELFKEKIVKAKNKREILEIFKEIDKNAFLNYKVDMKKFSKNINEFEVLRLEEQKRILDEFLDKNQLYVNLSSINDADFKISDDEKEASASFYGDRK